MLLDPSMLVSLSSCCEGGHGLHLVFVSLGSVTCTQLHSAALAHRQTFTLCPTFLLPCCVLALQAQSNLLVTVCRDKTFIYLEPNSDDKVHVRSSPLLLPSVRSPSLQVSVALCDVAKSTPTVWSSLISFLKCYFSAGSAGHHQLWLTKDHVRCSDVADSARSHQALSHALHTTDTCGHNRTAYQAEP